MLIYFLIASFIYFGAFSKSPKFYYYSGVFLLFLISAFRDTSLGGFDALNYERIFNDTPDTFTKVSAELVNNYSIGYIYLNSIIKTFSSNFIVFQFCYVTITTLLLVAILHKLHIPYKEKCLFLFSFFCFRYLWYEWVLIRQNMADLIFWLCVVLYYNARVNHSKLKYIYMLLTIALPPLFHTSAFLNIVLFPLLLLIEQGKIYNKRLFIILLSLFVYFASSIFVNRFFPYMVMLGGDRYDNYSEAIATEMGNGNIVNYLLRLLLYIFVIIKNPFKNNKLNSFYMSAMVLVVLIGSINFSSVNRLYEYYALALYFCMASFVNYYSKNIAVRLLYWAGMLVILGRFLVNGVEGQFLNYSLWL